MNRLEQLIKHVANNKEYYIDRKEIVYLIKQQKPNLGNLKVGLAIMRISTDLVWCSIPKHFISPSFEKLMINLNFLELNSTDPIVTAHSSVGDLLYSINLNDEEKLEAMLLLS